MRLMFASIIWLGAVASTMPASAAGQLTLQDLRQFCSSKDLEGSAACRFYVCGAFEGLKMAGSVDPAPMGKFKERKTGKQFCVPDDLALRAMVERVIKMADADLKAYPDDANMPAISFIGSVVSTGYSCP